MLVRIVHSGYKFTLYKWYYRRTNIVSCGGTFPISSLVIISLKFDELPVR